MLKRFLILFLICGFVLNSCQRELSLENANGPSEGSLQDDGAGDCLPKTVAGAYVVGTALVPNSNYIEVQVDVTQAGTYTIFTDTVNGMYFRTTGVFTTTGLNTVVLKGNGTPVAVGIDNFIVTYGLTGCTVAVTTVGSLAVFTLDGAPGGCTNAAVAGTYTAGTPLTAANTVTINVNVTAVGAYAIATTPSNGMIFSGSGVFTATGAQAVVLTGSQTPTTAGNTNIPITVGATSCSFTVNVVGAAGGATFTMNCASAVANGTYTVGTALAASNTITLTVDVATAGTYSITGTINGMTFSSAPGASFAAAGAGQNVTLTGTGNPTTAGANVVPLTGGTAGCNVTVTVVGAAGAAVFTVNCTTTTVNGTYTQNTALGAANTVTLNVTVATAGTYPAITSSVQGMTFSAPAGTLATGNQTITLTGSGTPGASGTIYVPITAGTTPCSFMILVVAPAANNDYFPRTTNSNWSYEFGDVANDSFINKVISNIHTALGNQYNTFMGNDGTGFDTSGYFRKVGNDYYRYTNLEAYLGVDNTQRVEFIFIKDNQPAGSSWTTPAWSNTVNGGTPIAIRIKFTITQKDVPITITTSAGTITYPNTIVIEEHYEADLGTGFMSLDTFLGFYRDYYSRNIGWIKDEYIDENGVLDPTLTMEARRFIVY